MNRLIYSLDLDRQLRVANTILELELLKAGQCRLSTANFAAAMPVIASHALAILEERLVETAERLRLAASYAFLMDDSALIAKAERGHSEAVKHMCVSAADSALRVAD